MPTAIPGGGGRRSERSGGGESLGTIRRVGASDGTLMYTVALDDGRMKKAPAASVRAAPPTQQDLPQEDEATTQYL